MKHMYIKQTTINDGRSNVYKVVGTDLIHVGGGNYHGQECNHMFQEFVRYHFS